MKRTGSAQGGTVEGEERSFGDLRYRLVRSSRRTLAIAIERDGALLVKAPRRMPLREIEEFLREKRRWIRVKQQEVLAFAGDAPGPLRIEDGARLSFLGEDLVLRIAGVQGASGSGGSAVPGTGAPGSSGAPGAGTSGASGGSGARLSGASGGRIRKNGEELIVPEGAARDQIAAWMKRQAKVYLGTRLEEYAERMNLFYASLRISSARGRWGSCSADKRISLTWRLMHCPAEEIDYVIVHELCHLIHLDHSKAFWAEVERVIPDYRERRKWLKDHAYLMEIL